MPHDHAPDMHLAGEPVNFDVGDPCRPSGAETGESTVYVARVGEPLSLEQVAVALLPLGRGVPAPPGPLGGGLDQLDGPFVIEQAQPELDGIRARFGRELIDVRFVREGIGQCRHAAQPRCPEDGRHVLGRHAQRRVSVGRHRGSVAHLEGDRTRLDGARQQQGERRRRVRRVRRTEVVGHRATLAVEAAADLHQLSRALGFPGVFLRACELRPHRTADRARHQQGVRGNVVGAVAAVATGCLEPDYLDRGVRPAEQQGEVRAQHVGALRPGPYRRTVGPAIGDGARWPD